MDEDGLPELKTADEVWAHLALAQANGLPFQSVLDLHTVLLTRIGRDYVHVWGPDRGTYSDDMRKYHEGLKAGAQYVLDYLEDDDEWYDFESKDDDLA